MGIDRDAYKMLLVSRKFSIPGKPIAKGRPRFSRMGKFVKTRTPEETINFENKVAVCCSSVKPNEGDKTYYMANSRNNFFSAKT